MADIARRLSFSSFQKNTFSMEKYLSAMEECDISELASYKMTESDGNIEEELTNLKGFFSKLKFNYMELYTKHLFLKSLENQEEFNVDPNQTNELKQNLKQIKARSSELRTLIENLSKTLSDSYERFLTQNRNLKSELEQVKRTVEQYTPKEDDTEDIMAKRKKMLESPGRQARIAKDIEPLKTKQKWQSQMLSIITPLSGIEVSNVGSDSLDLNLKVNSTVHNLFIQFQPETVIIQGVKMSPADVAIEDIVDYAKRTNDLTFLVREIKARIITSIKKAQEIAELSYRYKIESHPSSSIVTATLHSGLTLRIKVDMDYPMAGAAVGIHGWSGNPNLDAQMVMKV